MRKEMGKDMKKEMWTGKTPVIKTALTAAVLTVALTACGASTEKMSYENTASAPAAAAETYDTAAGAADYDGGVMITNEAAPVFEEEIAEEASYDYAEAPAEEPESEGGAQETVTQAAATERKLIKTVDISAETEDFDTLVPGLQRQVEALGGYIENNWVYEIGSYYVDDHMEKQRCANITARVPKEKLDGFLSSVAEQSNVTSHSESVEDVTLQYVDLESHKKALLTEQERLLELLSQAESVEDIIAIEGRLSEVRYQLESMESQLRTYDNKIDYSTVYLSIEEVRKYSAPQNATIGQRISRGFVKSLEDIGYGIQDFAIGFVIDIPYIVLWIVLIAVAVFVWRLVRKLWKKRAAKRGAADTAKRNLRWPLPGERGGAHRAEAKETDTEQGRQDEEKRGDE